MVTRRKPVKKKVEVEVKPVVKDEVKIVIEKDVAVKGKRYKATKVMVYHPFEKVRIPTGSPGVLLEGDSWLDCQIERGLIKEV